MCEFLNTRINKQVSWPFLILRWVRSWDLKGRCVCTVVNFCHHISFILAPAGGWTSIPMWGLQSRTNMVLEDWAPIWLCSSRLLTVWLRTLGLHPGFLCSRARICLSLCHPYTHSFIPLSICQLPTEVSSTQVTMKVKDKSKKHQTRSTSAEAS